MLPWVILVGGAKTKGEFVSFPLLTQTTSYQMELTHTELENDWQTNNVVPSPLNCNVSLRIIKLFCQVAVSNTICYLLFS